MQRNIFVLCLRRVSFFRQALFHKERVPDGLCSHQRFLFYASGGKKHYVKKPPAGGKKPTKKQAGEPHPPVSHKLAQLNSLAMEIS